MDGTGIEWEPYLEQAKLFAWQWAGYVALAVVAAFIGATYYFQKRANENNPEPTPTVLDRLGTYLRFSLKEDTRPLISSIPLSTYRNVFLLSVPVIGVCVWQSWTIPVAVIVLTLLVLAGKRCKPVLATREYYLNQVFEIAREKLKYKAGAHLAREGYVQIQRWADDLSTPAEIALMFPPSTDLTEAKKQEFEMHFTSQAIQSVVWDFEWEPANNRVVVKAQPPIPTAAYFPFPTIDTFGPEAIPMGVTIGGEVCAWKPQSVPHALVSGKSGSGKSVTQRNMLLHVLQSPDWQVILIDPKRVELSMYRNAEGVVRYAVNEEDMSAALEFALEEMSNRYTLMEEMGVPFYRSLPDPPAALMVMIDEAASLLLETGDKDIDALKKRNRVIVGRLAREGRAAGVHVILATQRPDAKWLGGDTRETVEGRCAMGKMSPNASLMTLNNVMATRTPGDIKGRGIWHDGAEFYPMQSYFFDADDVPAAIPLCNQLRRGEVDAGQVRAMLYPGGDTHEAASPSGGASRSWKDRVAAGWAAAQARAREAGADREDHDGDVEESGFDVSGWWQARRQVRAKQKVTSGEQAPAPARGGEKLRRRSAAGPLVASAHPGRSPEPTRVEAAPEVRELDDAAHRVDESELLDYMLSQMREEEGR